MSSAPLPADLLAHAGWLRGFARALVRDPHAAEDVAQATLARALERPPRDAQALPAWLRTVARNEARSRGRSEAARRARETRVARPEATTARVDEVVAKAELQRELVRRVLGLPEPYRTAVLLRYVEGLAPREIARRTGTPPATVRTRLKRGLDLVREDLDRAAGGDRRAWVAALVPLGAGARPGGGLRWLARGGGIVGTKSTVAALAALLALGAWLALRRLGPGAAPPPDRASAEAGGEGAPGAARLEGRPAPLPASGTDAPSPASVPPPAPASATAVRLRFVDESGVPLDADAVRARYVEAGLPSAVRLVAAAELEDGAVEARVERVVGPAGAWQRSADIVWGPGGPRVEAPAAGRWQVFADRPGAAPFLSSAIEVGAEAAVALDVVLPGRPDLVRVRLADAATGAPLAGARVTPVHEVGDDLAFLAGTPQAADAGGEVDLPVLEAALRGRGRPPTWWVEADGHAVAIPGWTLEAQDRGRALEVAVPATAVVTGTAWREDGRPAGGATVVWSRKGLVRRATVADDGTFRLEGVPAGAHGQSETLLLPLDGTLRTATAVLTPGGVAEVTLGTPGGDAATLEILVTAGGEPLPGVFFRAGDVAVASDAAGRARLPGLPAGPTDLEAWLVPALVDDFHLAPRAPIELARGAVRRLTLDLPAGVLRLRVVDDETGAPVASAAAMARPTDRGAGEDAVAGWRLVAGWAARADAEGRIRLPALVPGVPHAVECRAEGYAPLARDDLVPDPTPAPAEVEIRLRRP